MGQNFINDRALSDGSDDAGPAAAALAMEHVEGKGAFKKSRPRHGGKRRVALGCSVSDLSVASHSWLSPVGGNTNHVIAMLGISGKQAEVSDLVLAWRRYEHGNAANEGLRSETELLRAVTEDPLHREGHETVVEVQAILSDGRTKDVAKQAQARSLVVRADAGLYMQIVPSYVAGVAGRLLGAMRCRNFHRFHAELHGSVVLRSPLLVQKQTTAREQALNARSDACCQRKSLRGGDCRRRNEMQLAVSIFAIRTIEQRGMEVRRELQSTSESLHHAQARREQCLAWIDRARLLANESAHSAQEYGAHSSEQALIARHKHSQRERKRQNKLAQWNVRNDVIQQVQRKLVHFAANARAANHAAFTREPYESLVLAVRADNANKTSLDDATIKDTFELTPNEARQIDI